MFFILSLLFLRAEVECEVLDTMGSWYPANVKVWCPGYNKEGYISSLQMGKAVNLEFALKNGSVHEITLLNPQNVLSSYDSVKYNQFEDENDLRESLIKLEYLESAITINEIEYNKIKDALKNKELTFKDVNYRGFHMVSFIADDNIPIYQDHGDYDINLETIPLLEKASDQGICWYADDKLPIPVSSSTLAENDKYCMALGICAPSGYLTFKTALVCRPEKNGVCPVASDCATREDLQFNDYEASKLLEQWPLKGGFKLYRDLISNESKKTLILEMGPYNATPLGCYKKELKICLGQARHVNGSLQLLACKPIMLGGIDFGCPPIENCSEDPAVILQQSAERMMTSRNG